MSDDSLLHIEELEARFELAAVATEDASADCCGGSCCISTDCCGMTCEPSAGA